MYARNEVRLATGVCEIAARLVAHLLALVFATPSRARGIIEVTSQAPLLRMAQAARTRKKRRKIVEKTSQIHTKIVENRRKIAKDGASGAPGRSGPGAGTPGEASKSAPERAREHPGACRGNNNRR